MIGVNAIPCRFQSTPPVAGRRCPGWQETLVDLRGFQSTPPVAGRRCQTIDAPAWQYLLFQSTPVVCRQYIKHRRSFNPRLPLPGGDAEKNDHRDNGRQFQSTPPVAGRRCAGEGFAMPDHIVSIHASRCREAMQRFFRSMKDDFLFQSTPPVAGRRCEQTSHCCFHTSKFQSTPPVAGRRCFRRAGL